MGMDGDEMKRRVAELCCYLGLEEQYLRSTATLSGGQAQIVNLAAALVTDPELLILDEPTAQLDPTAAERFLSLLMRLQRQSGMTVLMAEHRLDGLIGQADRMLVLLEGRLIGDGRPSEILPSLSRHPRLHIGLPAAARLSMAIKPSEPPALDVAAFRRRFADVKPLRPLPPRERQDALGEALSLRGVSFSYEKDRPVLSGLSLSLSYGQTLCLFPGLCEEECVVYVYLRLSSFPLCLELFKAGSKDFNASDLFCVYNVCHCGVSSLSKICKF